MEHDRLGLLAQPPQPCAAERRVELVAGLAVIERAPVTDGNTRSSMPVKCSRRLSPSSATAAWSIGGTNRIFPDFGVFSSPCDERFRRTMIDLEAKSMSPHRRARSSPRRRPVNAATVMSAAVCVSTASREVARPPRV
jgi:hypothetical protein